MIQRQWARWTLGRAHSLHLSEEALLETVVERQEVDGSPSPAASHAATCNDCDAAVSQLASQLDSASAGARQAADELIGLDRLARQFDVIERRLGGQPGRVLHFPVHSRALRTQPRARRWIAMAAACGLVFGVAVGRLVGPGPASGSGRTSWSSAAVHPSPGGPTLETALADEHLLVEVDAALARAMHEDLLVLDELTPRGTDVAGRPVR